MTSGNLTESERRNWGLTARYSLRLPESLVRLRDRLNMTVAFSSSNVAVCILRVGGASCNTVSDSRRQQFDVRIDTGFSDVVRGGASLSYVASELRHTASRLTQVVFAVFADVTLIAGQIR